LRSFRDAHNTKCGGSKFAPPLGIRRFLKGGSQNRERALAASAIPLLGDCASAWYPQVARNDSSPTTLLLRVRVESFCALIQNVWSELL
jgi:hypothetical protein